jgi:hypothetical protein
MLEPLNQRCVNTVIEEALARFSPVSSSFAVVG